jgi:hypothetical protein
MTKSEAFSTLNSAGRITFGVEFFFPLCVESLQTTAFKKEAPGKQKDENEFHHPYFLDQLHLLLDSVALNTDIVIQQRMYWCKSGKWLRLDDASSSHTGVEPDFCTTSDVPGEPLLPTTPYTVQCPNSKYQVALVLEQKKVFAEVADQMEAVDYGERLLCIQHGRSVAYTALFHCCGKMKTIRWMQVSRDGDNFRTRVSRPADLSPGGAGLLELVTMLSKTTAELGLSFPVVRPDDGKPFSINYWLGEGVSSDVYGASWDDARGVVKIVKPSMTELVVAESTVFERLRMHQVPHVPSCRKVASNALFFQDLLTPLEVFSSEFVANIVDCLQAAHKAGIVHGDVRPENIMINAQNEAVLIDWGFASATASSAPRPFAGTFRYASNQVLEAAISSRSRVPQPQDDLGSLVRTVIAVSTPSLRRRLAILGDGEFQGALDIWNSWRTTKTLCEPFFEAADKCDYDLLKQELR